MRFSFFALLALALGAVNPTNAQSELEVFSEMGDAFTLYLNQMKMNEEPAPRVLVEVNAGFYQVRIDFEEPGRADLFKNNFGTEAGMRTTGKITMNRKGEFVLRPFGHVPMSQAFPQPQPPCRRLHQASPKPQRLTRKVRPHPLARVARPPTK